MRRMSFGLTKEQMRARTKTVTRRLGWEHLEPGERILAVDRVMGFKPGQRAEILGQIRVTDIRRERLDHLARDPDDVAREGFPEMTAQEFVEMFCAAMRVTPDATVTRIEFQHLVETVLVGMSPGPHSDPGLALYLIPTSSAGGRLRTMLGMTVHDYLRSFERVNLLREYPGPRWPSDKAKRAAAKMVPALRGRRVALVGVRVAEAFGLDADPFTWIRSDAIEACTVGWVYHPSGGSDYDHSDRADELRRFITQ